MYTMKIVLNYGMLRAVSKTNRMHVRTYVESKSKLKNNTSEDEKKQWMAFQQFLYFVWCKKITCQFAKDFTTPTTPEMNLPQRGWDIVPDQMGRESDEGVKMEICGS